MPLGRVMAIYHTALHDAAIAAWDAQVAHARPSPGATSDEITPAAGVDPDQPSFPSEHAAVAGAAATVLAYLLPDAAAGRFDALATEAAESRIAAGAAFRSDVEAGLALGQGGRREGGRPRQGRRLRRRVGPGRPGRPAPASGSRRRRDSSRRRSTRWPAPGRPGCWSSGDQVRPAPPPEYGSPAWQAELKMVQEIAANRSFEQERAALWWGDTSPSALLNGWAHELIGKEGLDLPHAAQVLADLHVAIADAAIAVWDAKFTWWTVAPDHRGPDPGRALPGPALPGLPVGVLGPDRRRHDRRRPLLPRRRRRDGRPRLGGGRLARPGPASTT